MECLSCKSLSGIKRISPGTIIYSGKFWIVDHAYPTLLPGWLVIVTKRHVEALHELTYEEFAELQKLQFFLIQQFHRYFNSDKEYLACFAEADNFKHIHFHLIPKTKQITDEFKGAKVFHYLKDGVENKKNEDEIIKISRDFIELFNSLY